jgi:hypothetical protein
MADPLSGRDAAALTKDLIDSLVENGVPEGRTIEYKQQLPGSTDSDKKEFLADLSSFANATGGHLIFGVEEKRDSAGKAIGVPDAAPGLAGIENTGVEIGRLDNLIRDGIDPRISGITIGEIPGFANGPVIAVHVPQSWAAPHMVDYKGQTRFYSRNNTGKYPLDVGEIRGAFALSEQLPERIRKFRQERLGRIIADETPLPIGTTAKIVLHLAPVKSFSQNARSDFAAEAESRAIYLEPLYLSSSHRRFNFDGFIVSARGPEKGRYRGYLQVFRSGVIEAVDTGLLSHSDVSTRPYVPSSFLEEKIIAAVGLYSAFLKQAGAEPPVIVMVSLLGVRRYQLAQSEGILSEPIDRNDLIVPEIVLEDLENDIGAQLRPIFDAIWQAAGESGSRNYDAAGHRKPTQSRISHVRGFGHSQDE